VIATQNPAEQVGTHPLPESQLDRFLMCIELGFPDSAAERALLEGTGRGDSSAPLAAEAGPEDLMAWQREVSAVIARPALLDYVHAQALELNENFEGAQMKLGQHEVHLQRQFEMENRSPRNFYPSITYDPDDPDRPYA
jgi:MoxR-like ATPase